jgi:hypothetical protein
MVFGLILFQSNLSQAKDKLIATPMNSPVKETYLKVKLEGFASVSEVLFKPKNGGSEVSGDVIKEGNAFIGKFKGSFLKPGKYEYRVKIITASGKSRQDEAASVAFINFEIDSSLGVADPGEAGKKTLAGIDSDNDGVRDDVQRWVNENYSNKPSTKNALFQQSKNTQDMLLNSNNREHLRSVNAPEVSRSIACLAWIRRDYMDATKALDKEIVNTEARVKSRLEAESQFGGLSRPEDVVNATPDEEKKFCKFSPSKE